MKKSGLIAVIALVSLAALAGSCARHLTFSYPRNPATAALEKSLRVIVECNDQVVGFGSAVASGAHEAITAKHVALMSCEDGSLPKFTLLSPDGTMRKAVVDWSASDIGDLARFSIRGEFRSWVYGVHEVNIGDRVLICAGTSASTDDVTDSFVCKEGLAEGPTTWKGRKARLISAHVVPGNSGGGVFDTEGRLVGILDAGIWSPEQESLGIMTTDLSGAI